MAVYSTKRDCLFSHLLVCVDTVDQAGPANMAIDELLLRTLASTGGLPILRLYGWKERCVSLGYFEPWASAERLREPATRRWTGGGLVFHGTPFDLTYTLLVPSDHVFSRLRPSASYKAIHERLVAILQSVGVDAALHDESSPRSPGGLCFTRPVTGDVVESSTGEKLAGAGQRRGRFGLMHQGCVRLTGGIPDGLEERLSNGFADDCVPLGEVIEESLVQQLITEKYGNSDWIARH